MTKPTSLPLSVKSSKNSLQNALLLLVVVVGLFMIYRYVKSIEGEVKILHNHFIELSEKVHNGAMLTTVEKDRKIKSKSKKNEKSTKQNSIVEEKSDEVVSDDNESVKSEDITNILRKVIGGDDGNMEELEEDNNTIDIMNKLFSNVVQNSIVEDNVQKCTVTEIIDESDEQKEKDDDDEQDDDEQDEEDEEEDENNGGNEEEDDDFIEIINKKNNSTNFDKVNLMKKTNEELKNLLKDKNLSTKGPKNELVERLLSCQ